MIQPFVSFSVTTVLTLAVAFMMVPANSDIINPSYAQLTFDTPSTTGGGQDNTSPTGSIASDEGEKFQLTMKCLFGNEVSEEDIINALDGNSDSTPTEQEIRDCFAPLYNTGVTTPTDDGSTADAGEEGSDEGEGGTDSEPSSK